VKQEQELHDQHDGFVAATGLSCTRNRELPDALEPDEPAVVEGRDLRRWIGGLSACD